MAVRAGIFGNTKQGLINWATTYLPSELFTSMSEPSANVTDASSRGRGRGRGKSRGGLGKYLRARGRGRGYGRPAEFGKRLLLEGEGPSDDEEAEEAAAEKIAKFSRRQLGTNADRYKEEEPELGSDGPWSGTLCGIFLMKNTR